MVLDNPPSYDSATGTTKPPAAPAPAKPAPTEPEAAPAAPAPAAPAGPLLELRAGPSYAASATATVHHYVHPHTGEHIATLLPPDHPEMVCLQQGEHLRHTRFGLIGILAAVFFFPLGVGLCLLDRRVRCVRCGRVLEDGVACG